MDYWTIALTILGGVIAVYYYLSSWKKSNIFDEHGIPNQKQISLLRYIIEVFVFPKPLTEIVKKIYNVHSEAKYIGIFDYVKPIIVIRDPELLKSVTIKNFDAFEDHLFFGEGNQDPFFKNNLMALRGDKWRDIRALLSPSFTSSKMKAMYQLITGCAVNFAEHLRNLPSAERVMEMKDVLSRYATDVIATCAFGIEVDSMRYPKNDFHVHGKKVMNFGMISLIKMVLMQHMPNLSRLLNLRIVDDSTATFFLNLIANTIKVRDEKGITRPDMLQLMMDSRGKREPGRELTIQDMTSHAFIFFLAGFETSSTLMSYASYVIACNPDIQEKLRNEIDDVLEDTNGQPTYEAINATRYLSAVINETLRMYPVQTLTDRLCVKDFELPPALPDAKPYTIKRGELIFLPVYALQHDANYFAEPEKFKPERFLDENVGECNLDAYCPFGIGPRMCIGNRFALLEIKVVFFHLLARCELKVCEKTAIPLKLVNRGFTALPKDGFWLEVVPRENPHRSLIADASNARQS